MLKEFDIFEDQFVVNWMRLIFKIMNGEDDTIYPFKHAIRTLVFFFKINKVYFFILFGSLNDCRVFHIFALLLLCEYHVTL